MIRRGRRSSRVTIIRRRGRSRRESTRERKRKRREKRRERRGERKGRRGGRGVRGGRVRYNLIKFRCGSDQVLQEPLRSTT